MRLLLVYVFTISLGCAANGGNDCDVTCSEGTTCSGGSCRTVCADASTCTDGEVCFLGVCSPTASAPSVIVLPTPALIDLDFTGGGLPEGVHFERASTAMTTGDGGVLATSAIDSPRFELDHQFGTSRGILVESATTNMCRASQQLDNSTLWWNASTGRAPSAANAPDGSVTATRLTPIDSTSYHSVGQSILATQNASYTFSFFLQAAELTNVYIGLTYDGSSFPNQLLDLETGTLSQINDQAAITDAGVLDSGNGWYRAWIALTNNALPGDLNVMLELGLLPVSDSGLNAWGCQFEAGVTPTSYLPTDVSAASTRSADTLLVDTPSRFDLARDFTVLVVQSVDVTTPVVAAGIALTATSEEGLLLGKRSNGNGWLTVTSSDGVTQINLAAGEPWQAREVHALAVSRRGTTVLLVDNGSVARITSNVFGSTSNPATTMRIGQQLEGSSASTHIQRVVLWQEALDEATLVDMTRP